MFLGSLFSGAGINATNPDEERDPPPQPTPLTFPAPAYSTSETADWTDPRTLPDLQQLFSKILRPSDVTSQHYDTFNIEILPACSVEDLVPPIRNGTSYSPPLDAAQDTPKASYADASKSDPVVAGQRNDYAERLAELAIDNDTVFRTLTRTVKGGVKPPRLAYMRKFYEGLESMSPYWDCSLDQYYEVDDDSVPEDAGKNHKRQRLDPGTTESSVESFSYSSEHVTTSGSSSSMSKEATSEGDSQPDRADEACTSESAAENRATEEERAKKSPSASPEPPPRTRYKGRRTSNGRGMPDQFRAGTVRAFVEGTVWPFQCSLTAPRHMPLLQLGKLNLPVRQTAAVYRLPKDRMTARQGRLEGPIVGLQVRSEIGFVEADGRVAVAKSRLDSLREIGGLLQLAQQRRRAGRKLEKPGEGQWWTTKARWGGGLGGEVESENGDIAQAAEELLNDMKERRGKDGGKGRRKKTPALLWKELKCGNGNWDPKTDYMVIGKPESDYDEVFMISSLNHHISILKLTVHDAYTDCITSGLFPSPAPTDTAWCKPRLERTEWLDLFDVDQRIAAFRALWGVMAYLTRGTDSSVTSEAQEIKMTDA